jgi:5-methylthioadenosine/S-adenosylhomocysteine deaminase
MGPCWWQETASKRSSPRTDLSLLQEKKDYDVVIDAAGKIVLPGFINAHGHAGMSLFAALAMTCLSWNGWKRKSGPWKQNFCPMMSIGAHFQYRGDVKRRHHHLYRYVLLYGQSSPGGRRKRHARRPLPGHGGNGPGSPNGLTGKRRILPGMAWAGFRQNYCHPGASCSLHLPSGFLKKVMALRDRLNIPLQIHLAETEWEVAYCREHLRHEPHFSSWTLSVFSRHQPWRPTVSM